MTKFILLVWMAVLFVHCADKKKLPKGVIGKEKMEDVMWDMMQADQFLSDFVLNKNDSLDTLEEHTSLYNDIFRLHKTNREEFTKSFRYYRSQPALMKEVLDSLSMRSIVERLPAPIPQVDDSVREKKIKFVPRTLSND